MVAWAREQLYWMVEKGVISNTTEVQLRQHKDLSLWGELRLKESELKTAIIASRNRFFFSIAKEGIDNEWKKKKAFCN